MIRMCDHNYPGLKFNRKLVFLLISYWFVHLFSIAVLDFSFVNFFVLRTFFFSDKISQDA